MVVKPEITAGGSACIDLVPPCRSIAAVG